MNERGGEVKFGSRMTPDEIQTQETQQSHTARGPEVNGLKMKHDKITHPGNVLLTGKW